MKTCEIKYTYKFEKVKDIPLHHLDLSEFDKWYPDFKTWLKTSAFEKDCISVYDKSTLIAYCIFHPKPNCKYIENSNVYKISSIFVDPRYRRQSIGTIMILYMEHNVNPTYVYLTVNEKNDDVRKFIEKMGFKNTNIKKERINDLIYIRST